uniref:Cytochrome b-c1 complex subunit 9 n=1 Tax=Trichogramma kaykai TaxID=54128 RepID=A0ABD2XH11_9HYME
MKTNKNYKSLIYHYIFKRTSTFILAVVVTSVFFERTYDHLCEAIFERINRGRLWRHIKHKYENNGDEDGFSMPSADDAAAD